MCKWNKVMLEKRNCKHILSWAMPFWVWITSHFVVLCTKAAKRETSKQSCNDPYRLCGKLPLPLARWSSMKSATTMNHS